MVSDSVRNAAPAPVGMRYSGTAACSRSRLTATPPSRETAEARIGSASKRPMIQPVASARRASTEPGTPPPSYTGAITSNISWPWLEVTTNALNSPESRVSPSSLVSWHRSRPGTVISLSVSDMPGPATPSLGRQ